MPLSRRKSCQACRVAKARCSRTSPCSRCQMRHESCDYGDSVAGWRGTRHQPQAMASASTHSPGDSELLDGHAALYRNQAANGTESGPTEVTTGLPDPHGLTTDTEAGENVLPWLPWSYADSLDQLDAQSYEKLRPVIEKTKPHLSFLNSAGSAPRMRLPYTSHHANHSISFSSSNDSTMNLSVSSLTSKVLISQLLSYPGMMLGNQLPPFIFPSCTLGESCTGARGHQCLPTSLAICRAIVSMFDTMTPSNQEFIWSTVCREAERLRRESSTDRFQLLGNLQSCMIYMLLCAKYLQQIGAAKALGVVSATRVLGKRLNALYDYTSGASSARIANRHDWIFIESARRTICVLYGIDLLFDVFSEGLERCHGYLLVPLPCKRDLWEPVSDQVWKTRYRHSMSGHGGNSRDVLRIGALRASQDPSVTVSESGGNSPCSCDMSKVSDWCEGADELGTLIWMAVMLERGK
ncbi:hypothetical protein JDV02_010492 [Purpureocillium takamizusanense]|uniref:Zn(2)-C6 fungal-type domain-containing protein n=1 Tax=Purpureocillium takamizusanense TaxID=2060973 RepID=A0A9Q8VGL3_9HYPO|nr:uncharacterized protein JDV02_010492 [Purpureocillium takamizusanense]UNI24768.1 hypothetical protein JDV02_010492 [Purpureocillium takamizusanense]